VSVVYRDRRYVSLSPTTASTPLHGLIISANFIFHVFSLLASIRNFLGVQREWKSRIERIPHRIVVAIAKYHAVTLVMRLYEYIASKLVTEETLDKLTLDTSMCAKSLAVSSTNGVEYVGTMFSSCWNANMISYLADYSVHQMILLYGYYLYIQQQQRKRKVQSQQQKPLISDSANNSSSAIEKGSIALSCLKSSVLLMMNRTLCLTMSSLGSACGSFVYPGIGTLIGFNVGDTLAINFADEYIADKSTTLLP
jgi:hypothetical protein